MVLYIVQMPSALKMEAAHLTWVSTSHELFKLLLVFFVGTLGGGGGGRWELRQRHGNTKLKIQTIVKTTVKRLYLR